MSGSDKLADLKEEFIRMMEYGWGRKGAESIKGRIVALIYLSPAPLTQEEIAKSIINEKTKKHYSQSQISRHLKDLVEAGIISNKSKAGTKIQLYEERETSTFDNFQLLLKERKDFLIEIVEIMDRLVEKWNSLPKTSKESVEGKKFWDVISNYNSAMNLTLDIVKDYIQRFDSQMKGLKNE
ncbi:MAG: ArsR family transcriptional regulator [Candidatus Odinarchaeota archaeon]